VVIPPDNEEYGMRRGQSSVEVMLMVSVFVVAVVAAGWQFGPTFVGSMESLSQRAETAYTDGSIAQ
jgi:hypothetical protein